MIKIARNNYAFTLLELLVALALMTVIAGALYASLYIGFKAKENSEGAIKPIRAACIVMEILEQDISAATPPTGILAGGFEGVDKRGESGCDFDSLTFYSSSHKPRLEETACDIIKIELALTESDDAEDYVLVRRITTNLLSPRSLEPVEEVLCRGVRALDLKYSDGFAWVDEWDSTVQSDTLPTAVQISLEIQCQGPLLGRTQPGDTADRSSTYRLTHAFIVPCNGSMQQSGQERRQPEGSAGP